MTFWCIRYNRYVRGWLNLGIAFANLDRHEEVSTVMSGRDLFLLFSSSFSSCFVVYLFVFFSYSLFLYFFPYLSFLLLSVLTVRFYLFDSVCIVSLAVKAFVRRCDTSSTPPSLSLCLCLCLFFFFFFFFYFASFYLPFYKWNGIQNIIFIPYYRVFVA